MKKQPINIVSGVERKPWNSWYAYEDQNGNTEWDALTFDDFERWAADGMRHNIFEDVDGAVSDFVDNLEYLAEAEQRHIPYETREECEEDCVRFVERWNRE